MKFQLPSSLLRISEKSIKSLSQIIKNIYSVKYHTKVMSSLSLPCLTNFSSCSKLDLLRDHWFSILLYDILLNRHLNHSRVRQRCSFPCLLGWKEVSPMRGALTKVLWLRYWSGQKVHSGFSISSHGKTWMNFLAKSVLTLDDKWILIVSSSLVT